MYHWALLRGPGSPRVWCQNLQPYPHPPLNVHSGGVQGAHIRGPVSPRVWWQLVQPYPHPLLIASCHDNTTCTAQWHRKDWILIYSRCALVSTKSTGYWREPWRVKPPRFSYRWAYEAVHLLMGSDIPRGRALQRLHNTGTVPSFCSRVE